MGKGNSKLEVKKKYEEKRKQDKCDDGWERGGGDSNNVRVEENGSSTKE